MHTRNVVTRKTVVSFKSWVFNLENRFLDLRFYMALDIEMKSEYSILSFKTIFYIYHIYFHFSQFKSQIYKNTTRWSKLNNFCGIEEDLSFYAHMYVFCIKRRLNFILSSLKMMWCCEYAWFNSLEKENISSWYANFDTKALK